MVSTELSMITSVIEAHEGCDVATSGIPNVFVQTNLPSTDQNGVRTITRLRGPVMRILSEIDKRYKDDVVQECGVNTLYVYISRAIYGLLLSAILFHKKLLKDLQDKGYVIKPYDSCVANK